MEGTDQFGRVFAPAGTWALVIDLFDYSLGHEAEFEMIQGRERDGLPVIDLPPSLRWAGPTDRLMGEMEVQYGGLRIVAGCGEFGRCSPDGRITVVATGDGSDTDPDADLSEIRVRVID